MSDSDTILSEVNQESDDDTILYDKKEKETIQPTQSNNYKLYSWIIKPVPQVCGICVDGKLK
jgi:hypothetical protein